MWSVWVSIVTALITSGTVTAILHHRKRQAETGAVWIDAAGDLATSMQEALKQRDITIKEIRTELQDVRNRETALWLRVEDLEKVNRALRGRVDELEYINSVVTAAKTKLENELKMG